VGTSTGHGTILERTSKFRSKSLDCCESKHRKTWADEECSKSVDRRKQAELQWLQNPSEANEDNLSDVRRDASRHFRTGRRNI
jgi:hypothetical protein